MSPFLQRIHSILEPKGLQFFLVLIFFLASIAIYEHSQRYLLNCSKDLQEKKRELEKKRTQALQEHQNLMLAINSQSDPAFVEITLIKVLGVLPEGHIKIYFKDRTEI